MSICHVGEKAYYDNDVRSINAHGGCALNDVNDKIEPHV